VAKILPTATGAAVVGRDVDEGSEVVVVELGGEGGGAAALVESVEAWGRQGRPQLQSFTFVYGRVDTVGSDNAYILPKTGGDLVVAIADASR
jgi:hypothetical protein